MDAAPVTALIIDLRTSAARQNGVDVLSIFDHLGTGETFILVSDNACKMVYRLFVHERGGQFSWTYLRAVSGDWRIRVGRKPGSAPQEDGRPPSVCEGAVNDW